VETVAWHGHDVNRAAPLRATGGAVTRQVGPARAADWLVSADVSQRDVRSRKDTSGQGDEAGKRRDALLFVSHRARLLRIAHRMLGSRDDAEDLVQDVYLRWHRSAKRDIASPLAFLITMTGRLCVDRLRLLKRQRAECLDAPSTESDDHAPSPEMQIEFTQEVSGGFVALLERLGPEERAAFLLHDVFDYDYKEVGRFLGRAEAACRQIVHRARARLRDSRARFAVPPECRGRVFRKFLAAIGGDREAVMALLAEEVKLYPHPN
jgi:RNA polymerase sigma-70 factor (ECF subfamily)